MFWNISPSCEVNGSQVFLTDNSSGNYGDATSPPSPLTVYTPINDPTLSKLQLWYPIYNFSESGFVLLNAGTNNLIQFNTSATTGYNISLIPDSCSQETDANLSTPIFTPGGPNSEGYGAVRPISNDSYNLNVSGNTYDVGNPVIFFNGWGGGAPNEIWTFNCGSI